MQKDTCYLYQMKNDEFATVSAIEAGHMLQARLASMGILPDTTIKLIKKSTGGPLIVEVKGVKIAIGQGMAKKIVVKPIRGNPV